MQSVRFFGKCLAASAILLTQLVALAQAQTTFSNSGTITIPDSGTATPYPSAISVTGLTGTITDVNVTIFGISHTFIDDVGAILVGPGGQKTFLFDGAGDTGGVSNLTWTFDDSASAPLANTDTLTSGTFQPNSYFPGDVLDPPAPGGPYATSLSIFNGSVPNGTYNLFVEDFVPGDSGSISGGWSITITTNAVTVPEPGSIALLLGGGLVGALFVRRRRS